MNSANYITMLILCVISSHAYAWPENVRLGYTSCSSCHVSPAGGRTLTDYGKSTAEELSSWAYEGEGRSDYGLAVGYDEIAKRINIGGDLRYAWLKYRDDYGSRYVNFPMQGDLEAALHVLPGLTVVGSLGRYSREKAREYRTHYMLMKPSRSIALRLGRFMPAYGLLIPDHTAVTRQNLGFGQGSERYNAELSFIGKYGEIFLTGSMGSAIKAKGNADHGLKLSTDNERATIVRAAAYLGERITAGASWYFGRRSQTLNRFGGLFATYGITPTVYGLVDATYRPNDNAKSWRNELIYRKTYGWEYLRGAHVRYNSGWDGALMAHGIELLWYPRPHWELTTQWVTKDGARRWMALLHYYL